MVNKHGLSRDIPLPVKRAVRSNCGFGCVLCGASVVEYEHVDPPFENATEHDPERIALLCPSCHGNVTRGFWSKDKVLNALKRPFCRSSGFSWGAFDFGQRHPAVRFGGVLLRNCRIPILVGGFGPLFQIEEPEEDNGPFRLSAIFTDASGKLILEIAENEWRASSDSFDTEFTGGRIVVRDKPGSYSLVLVAEPPDGIRIERLRMNLGRYLFEADPHTLLIHQAGGAVLNMTNCVMDGARVGLSL